MRDTRVPTSKDDVIRAKLLRLEQMHTRLSSRLRSPTMPIYDPDFPLDAVNGQHAMQAGVPYYFWNGTWYPFDAPSAPGTPTAMGSATWLIGGYKGLITHETKLVGYYRMNEASPSLSFADSSGVLPAVALTLQPGAAHSAGFYHHAGMPNNAADYAYACTTANPTARAASTGDYFDAGFGNKLRTATSFSWECWTQFSSGQARSVVDPLGFYSLFDNQLLDVAHNQGPGLKWQYRSTDAGPFITYGVGGVGGVTSAALTADTWYHVVATYDNVASKSCLYINGVLVGSFQGDGRQIATDHMWVGGNSPYDVTFGINYLRTVPGVIDEVAFYSAALSAADVLLHFNATGGDADVGRWITIPYGSGALVGAGEIDTAQLADNSVTTAKIQALAVTAAKIAANTITAGQIAAATITDVQVAAANKDGVAGTASMRTLGTGATQATGGQDARLFVKATPTYSASITPNAGAGQWQTITVTNATAFTINAPTSPPASTGTQLLTIEILNSSGGAMGAITWNAAFVLVAGAFTNPASTFKRSITFAWNGLKWVEVARASADY